MTACASRQSYVWVQDLPQQVDHAAALSLEAGDKIYVFVRDQESLSGEHVIAADGTLSLPILGQVPAAGESPERLAAGLEKRLARVVQQPTVSVALVEERALTVVVMGEVQSVGIAELKPGSGVVDALARAGGLSEFADPDSVYVVRRGNQPLRVRFDYDLLTTGDTVSNRFALRDGDVIVVE